MQNKMDIIFNAKIKSFKTLLWQILELRGRNHKSCLLKRKKSFVKQYEEITNLGMHV